MTHTEVLNHPTIKKFFSDNTFNERDIAEIENQMHEIINKEVRELKDIIFDHYLRRKENYCYEQTAKEDVQITAFELADSLFKIQNIISNYILTQGTDQNGEPMGLLSKKAIDDLNHNPIIFYILLNEIKENADWALNYFAEIKAYSHQSDKMSA